jgi:hypothetical protein
MRYDSVTYRPATYRATWGKASAGLMFWAVLMVGLMIYGGIGTALMMTDPDPGYGERYRHSSVESCAMPDALADRGRS